MWDGGLRRDHNNKGGAFPRQPRAGLDVAAAEHNGAREKDSLPERMVAAAGKKPPLTSKPTTKKTATKKTATKKPATKKAATKKALSRMS